MSEYNLVDEARDSLGDFCMNECKAYCCKKGTLPITIKELELFEEKNVSIVNGEISLLLPCVKLSKDNMCGVYETRPKICKEFPIHQSKKILLISNRCLGVMQEKLYPYIKRLKEEGYEVKIC